MTSLVAQTVKCLPTMQETQVWTLGREGPLEKEMATHSSTLAWKIPWKKQPGILQSMGSQRVRHDWATSLTHSLTTISLWLALWAWMWVSFSDGFQHPLINGCLTAICDFGSFKRLSNVLLLHHLEPISFIVTLAARITIFSQWLMIQSDWMF